MNTKLIDAVMEFFIGRAVLQEFDDLMSGYCNICHEKYVGLAQDCRCTGREK